MTLEQRATELRRVSIESVSPFAYGNPRQMTDAMRKTLARSLTEFGAVEPIVVREKPGTSNGKSKKKEPPQYEVLNGHHRLDAMRELGEAEVDVVVVNLPDDKKARALVLALNKISADWDYSGLAEYVNQLMSAEGTDVDWLRDVTGFSADELHVLEAAAEDLAAESRGDFAGMTDEMLRDAVQTVSGAVAEGKDGHIIPVVCSSSAVMEALLERFKYKSRFVSRTKTGALDGDALLAALKGGSP